MAIHKIQINDFISEDYELIAIHSSLEDYKLAYAINTILETRLIKNESNIEIAISEGKSAFSNYIFDDEESDVQWSLIENKTTIVNSKKKTSQLFDQVDITVFLLPEYKKADYLLKIENIENFAGCLLSRVMEAYTFTEFKLLAEYERKQYVDNIALLCKN